ncbi:MAG TPA: nucleotidyltransferase family protein [Acidimicrobiales bacterium]|nr:nucleotidyltransferase family protein [Acidimicrobiales bacterium]
MPEGSGIPIPGTPLLRAVAAYGLPGTRPPFPTVPLPDGAWADLLGGAGRQRVVGLLAAAVGDGAFEVSAGQRDELADVHCATMTRVLDIEAAAVHVVGLLGGAGVDVRVLKGLAAAHLDLPDPSQREFGDADLLVRPSAFAPAVELLVAAGLPRDLPERRAGFDRRFGKDATVYGRSGVEIDLHRTLALGAFGMALEPDLVWDDGEPFRMGPHEVRALAPAARLVHACYSAVLGDRVPRLPALRDVAALAGRADMAADVVVRLAERGRGGSVVALGVRLAAETMGTGSSWPLSPWARARPQSRWERTALASYESHGGTNTSTLLAGVLGLSTAGARLSYLSALAFPARHYLSARRDAGRPSERRQGLHELALGRRARRTPG